MDVKHPSMMDVVPRFAAPSEIQLTCNDSEVTASPEVMHVINAVNALICIVGLGGNGLVVRLVITVFFVPFRGYAVRIHELSWTNEQFPGFYCSFMWFAGSQPCAR